MDLTQRKESNANWGRLFPGRMVRFFRQPFPFQFLFSEPYWAIGGLTVFIFLFLLIIEPVGFGTDEFNFPRPLVALVYAAIPGVVILAHRYFFRSYLTDYSREDEWTFGKELLLYVSVLLFCGLFNTLSSFVLDSYAPPRLLARELARDMYHTIVIGLIPITLLNLASLIVLLRRNQIGSAGLLEQMNDSIVMTPRKDVNFHFKSTTKKDELIVSVDDMMFIKAEGNYVDVYLENGEHKTVRFGLQQLESELTGYPSLYRCHRSYVINLNKIQAVQGNAMGMVLTFPHGLTVPVSRSKLREFKDVIAQNKVRRRL